MVPSACIRRKEWEEIPIIIVNREESMGKNRNFSVACTLLFPDNLSATSDRGICVMHNVNLSGFAPERGRPGGACLSLHLKS